MVPILAQMNGKVRTEQGGPFGGVAFSGRGLPGCSSPILECRRGALKAGNAGRTPGWGSYVCRLIQAGRSCTEARLAEEMVASAASNGRHRPDPKSHVCCLRRSPVEASGKSEVRQPFHSAGKSTPLPFPPPLGGHTLTPRLYLNLHPHSQCSHSRFLKPLLSADQAGDAGKEKGRIWLPEDERKRRFETGKGGTKEAEMSGRDDDGLIPLAFVKHLCRPSTEPRGTAPTHDLRGGNRGSPHSADGRVEAQSGSVACPASPCSSAAGLGDEPCPHAPVLLASGSHGQALTLAAANIR